MTHRSDAARPVPPARPGFLAVLTAVCTATVLLGGSAFAISLTSAEATGVSSAAPAATPLPTVTVTPFVAPLAKPTAKSKVKPKSAKPMTLAQLREAVKTADAEIELRTRQYEATVTRLATAKKRLVTVRAAAAAARKEADTAHVDLGKYAAAAYRGGQVSPELTVLMGPPAGATDTLRNLQNLEQAGEIKTDITTYAVAAAARAAALEAEADALVNQNAIDSHSVQVQRDEARIVAQNTQLQLTAEMERIAAERLKALAKDCQKKAKIAAEYPNGLIPLEALCSTGIGDYLLRGDAAVAFKQLAAAYEKDFDRQICLTSAYRNRALQAKLYAADTVMVAMPGKSHHGLGLATDLCGGIENFGTKQHEWMKENAGQFGFFHPDWAQPGGVTPEPWHWEYDPTFDPEKAEAAKTAKAGTTGKAAKPADG